jgi:hypothetical protein
MTTTRTYSGSTHTGYTVENEFGAVVAEVIPSRRRVPNAGYFVRLYTTPESYSLLHVPSIIDARMLAEDHAGAMA